MIEDVPDMVREFFKSTMNLEVDLDSLQKSATKYKEDLYYVIPPR